MQKVYQRINWENDPSTKTAINEDNLNKMDYALDQIDNRVVALSGYQDRVAQAEKNAKTSETNAKTSETNAKQSELKAKEYMENAFNGTPEGYESLITKVDLLDINKTASSTLQNSKHGGARLTKVVGNTEQKKLSGKNLVDVIATTQTINGLTVTINLDKTITVNGTAAEHTEIKLSNERVLANGKYKMVGCPSGGSAGKYQLTTFYNDSKIAFIVDYGDGNYGDTSTKDFDVSTHKNLAMYFNVRKGVTVNNLVFKPMLVDATKYPDVTYDDYEPYLGGVEVVQGAYDISNGAYVYVEASVCGDISIPCKQNDVIKIDTERLLYPRVLFYNGNTFVSHVTSGSTAHNTYSVTVPSGVDNFKFYLNEVNGLSPQTVGKVSLTVNGKPIYVHSGAYEGGMTSPSPYYPQSMYHTSDVVEMIQGYYNRSTGLYTSSTYHVCSKNKIPCKSGDVVKVNFDVKATISIVYFANGVFNSYSTGTDVTEHSATIPSGTTHFTVHASKSDGTEFPIDTLGKITLTINGKYVNVFREHGKNFVKGFNAHANIVAQMTDIIYVKPNTDYVVSIQNSGLNGQLYVIVGGTSTIIKSKTFSDSIELPFNSGGNDSIQLQINITNGDNTVTVPILNGCVQLEEGTVATPFDEYQETVAYFLTEKPMMADSHLFREDGLVKVEHGSAEVIFDGDENINVNSYYPNTFTLVFNRQKAYGEVLCTHYVGIKQPSDLNVIDMCVLLGNSGINLKNSAYSTVDELKNALSTNPITLKYELATPYIETLDTESQLSLHSLETFDNVTYLDFDSRVKPKEIEVEYGTSQVGAYTLQSLNNTEANAIRLDALLNTQATVATEVTEPTQATE